MARISAKDAYFNFSTKVEKFSNYLTPEFQLSGVPWKIKVVKRAADGEDVMDVFLECSPDFEPNTLDWSVQAQATIKLLSDTPGQQPYKKKILKTEFNKDSQSNGLVPFINWSDLKRYEQNGKVCFDIHLSTNPIKVFIPTETELRRTKFRFIVKNISKMDSQTSSQTSPQITIRGNNWSVRAVKRNEHLGIFLVDKRKSLNENWTWKAMCSVKLLSFDEDVNPIVRKIEQIFNSKEKDWGYKKFVSWEELTKADNKYVLDDKIMLEIDLEVEPAKPLWNFDCEQAKPDIGILECSVCLLSVIGREPTATKCGHLFCGPCIKRIIEERKKCPLCNVGASLPDLRAMFLTT